MPTADINYLGVVLAALLFMAVGFVWYSLNVFGRDWMKAVGLKEKDIKNAPGTGYVVAMVASLLQAFVIAHLVDYAQADTATEGLVLGLWIGIGLVAAALATNYSFAQRSQKLFLIDAGYFVTALALSGMLLAVWR